MDIGKDALKILELAYNNETIDLNNISKVEKSVHAPYSLENIDFLEKSGLIFVQSEYPQGEYQRVTIRITPAGQAEFEAQKARHRDVWITRGIAIAALVVSIIALTRQ